MRKRYISIIFTAFILGALALTSCGQKAAELRMGTAGSGGIYDTLGSALADAISRADNNMIVDAGNTSGSAANLRLLSEGQLHLAIVQYDLAADAYYAVNKIPWVLPMIKDEKVSLVPGVKRLHSLGLTSPL